MKIRVNRDGTLAAFSGPMMERESWKLFGVCVVLACLLSVFVLDPLLGGGEYWGAGQSSTAR